MATFGSDFSAFPDLDANFTFLEGDAGEAIALAQAVARRITTPRGALFYAPSYGMDIRAFVSDVATPESVQNQVENEIRKDERIDDCKCTITVTGDAGAVVWIVDILCYATQGKTFRLTLEVSKVSVTLLKGG